MCDLSLMKHTTRSGRRVVGPIAVSRATENLYACSSDRNILRWISDDDSMHEFMKLHSYPLDIHVTSLKYAKGNQGSSVDVEMVSVACANGSLLIVHPTGTIEKSVVAHDGSCTCVRWNHDGDALATGGEDGTIRIWSRSGMLRSNLFQSQGNIIFSVSWNIASDAILATTHSDIIIKSIQPTIKQSKWTAHEGCCFMAQWNNANNMIVSCGEDRRVIVWDSYGRELFASNIYDSALSSVSWHPSGHYFLVSGDSFFSICERNGSIIATQEVETSGNIFGTCWDSSGNAVITSNDNGLIQYFHFKEMRMLSSLAHRFTAITEEENVVKIHDAIYDSTECVGDFANIMKLSFRYGYLVILSEKKCDIYLTDALGTPNSTIEISAGNNSFILQSNKYIMLTDRDHCMKIYRYDGSFIFSILTSGIRNCLLNSSNVDISDVIIAHVDLSVTSDTSKFSVQIYESGTGHMYSTINHPCPIDTVLVQQNTSISCCLLIIDSNRDMFAHLISIEGTDISPRMSFKFDALKLLTNVKSACWNENNDMLVAISDNYLECWYCSAALFLDEKLASLTKCRRDNIESCKDCTIVSFAGSKISLRRKNGSQILIEMSPLPGILHELVLSSTWGGAIQLCRLAKSKLLWACLSCLSIHFGELSAAEIAFTALDETDKVQYLIHVKGKPEKVRKGSLSIFKRRLKEAESHFVNVGLIYRAIRMNLLLQDFDRALDLAVQHKTHVDTVLYFRSQFLALQKNNPEKDSKFLSYSEQISWNEQAIRAKIASEKLAERNSGG